MCCSTRSRLSCRDTRRTPVGAVGHMRSDRLHTTDTDKTNCFCVIASLRVTAGPFNNTILFAANSILSPLLSRRHRFWYSRAEDHPERGGAEGIPNSEGFCRQSHWPDSGSGKRHACGQRGGSVHTHRTQPSSVLSLCSLRLALYLIHSQGPFVHIASICAAVLSRFMAFFSGVYQVTRDINAHLLTLAPNATPTTLDFQPHP